MKGIFGKLRRALALMMACMMLLTSVAYAEPGASVSTVASTGATLTLPAMMKVIGDEAFKGDTSVQNVVLPDGATTIGAEAFAGCTALQSVTIPDSVTDIADSAFDGCGDIVIICSSGSKAAVWAKDMGYRTQFTDQAAVEMVWDQSIFTAYPADQGGMYGCVVLVGKANGYDEAAHGAISWELERIDENQDVQLDLYLIEYGATAFVRMPESYATGGSVTYRLTAKADAFTESHEFTVELASMPEDLPGGVGIHQTHYEVGDTLDFGKDDLYFDGGCFDMDASYVALSVPYVDEYPIFTQNEAELTDDGFRVTFTKDGRYEIPVWMLANNALCYDGEIVITVGTGVCENANVSVNLNDSNQIFCGAENLVSLGTVRLNDFVLLDGETIEWSIESVNGEGLIDLSCAPADWNKYFAEIRVDGVHSEPGTETFRMTAAVGETEYSETFEIILLERPETLPTDEDVLLENDVYHVNIGDTFEFTYDRIGLDETNLPEGMSWQAAIWNTESSDYLPVEWTDEGFRVTFDQEGTHTFYAAVILTADYSVGREFTIVVGDGFENDLSLSVGKSQVSMYLQEHDEGRDHWLTDFDLEGFDYENPPMVDWKLEILEHDGEEPAVYAYMDISEERPRGGLIADGFTGETGSVTFRVHCIVERVHDFWQDVTVYVDNLPENLPGGEAIQLERDYHELNVGDTFEFTYEDFGFDASSLPEGMSWEKEIHETWLLEQNSDFEWIEDGFRVTFTENGRFVFYPAIRLGANLHISRPVTIKVGDGVSPDFDFDENYVTDTLYIGGHDSWIISVGVYGYTPPAGTDLCWELYPAEGQGEHLPVEAFDNGTWSDGAGNYEIMVNANPASDEPGEATWILKAVAGDEVVYEKTLTLKLVAKPDDLNIVLDVTQDEYHVQAGEVFRYNFSNIQEGEGFSAPEGATTLRATYINDHFWDNETFQWVYEDGKAVGLEIVFDQPGRYMFESGIQVSNFTEVEQIVVIVDEDPTMYVDWGTDVLMTTLKGSTQIGELFMDNFFLHDGEEVKWEVRKVSGDADVNMYAADEWDMGCRALLYAELNPGAVGDTEATFEIAAYGFDGREYTRQFTIFVKDGNVELPGEEAITVPQEVYYLNVGDRFTFSRGDFDFDESAMPEGYTYNKQIWGSDALDRLETMEWFPGGFTVTFDEPGRYEFRAAVVYAAETMVWKDVFIIVGDGGINDADLQCNYYIDTVYAEGGDRMQSSYELTGYNIIASDKVEWKLERSNPDAEQIVDLRITWYSDDNSAVDINAAAAEGMYGSDEYILTCVVNGVEIASVAIPVTAAALPENMPTELRVDWDYIHVNQGDEVYFGYDMFETADGEIPEGVFTDKEIWFGDGWENSGEFEWVEGGFRFVPHRDGVYTFTAAVLIGNYTVEKQNTIVVGEGVPEGLEVHWSDNAFIFTKEDPNDMWVTEARVQDYEPIEGYEIDWYAERVSETNLLEVYCENMDERGTFANFHAYRISEETGEEIWRIVGEIRGHRVVEREITFRVVDSAEGLPTRLWVDSEEYNIAVGQEFVFTRDMFGPEDGEIPEDICPNYDLWIDDRLTEHAGFEWIENGFRFVPDADGRYDFHVALLFGNYQISKRVVINVGTGVHPDFSVDWEDNSFIIFKDREWTWIANADIHNYAPPAGCDIEWFVECKTEGEDQVTNLRFADIYNGGLSASFHGDPTSDQNGEDTWRIVAQAGEAIIVDREITLTLMDLPENIPADIWVENDDIHIEVGEEFVFDTTMFEVGEGEIPEGTRAYKFVDVPENVYDIYGFDWTDNGGFYVKPDRDGRFNFKAAVEIGNHRIYRTITVTVGTGEQNYDVHWNDAFFSIYRNYEHNHDSWVLDANINGYTPAAGCQIVWSVEPVGCGEDGIWQTKARIDNIWDDDRSASVVVHLNEHELGDDIWRVVARAGEDEIVSREFTVYIEDLPETFPTELWIDCDYFEINPGDEFSMFNSQFGPANGELSEDQRIEYEFWLNDRIQHENEFEWLEDGGFRFRPMQDGTYVFDVAIRISNYAVAKTVTVKVGSGVNPDFGVDWDEGSFTMYTGQNHDMWVMDAHIHDYDLPDGMSIEWYIEQPHEDWLWETDAYIGNVWDDGYTANIFVRFADPNNQSCGADTWRVIAKVGDEVIVERDFAIWIEELPEGIFTALVIEQDYFEIQPGDEISMNYDQISWDGGDIPDGARLDKHIWIPNQMGEAEGFEWTDNGFRFQPMEDGLYSFEVAVSVGNYVVSKRIVVVVGEGKELKVEKRENSCQLYKGGHDVWVMDVTVNDYVTGLDWSLTRDNEEEPLYVEPFFVWNDSDDYGNYSLRVNANQMSDESGSNLWYLRATLAGEVVYEYKLPLSLVDYPEEGKLNIDVAAHETEYRVEVGETFSYAHDNVEEGVNFVKPDDAGLCRIMYLNDSITDNESFVWTDTGFDVVFSEPGRYVFEHGLQVNNYTKTVWITIIVGHEPWMDVHCKSDMVLSSNEHGGWFAYLTLNDFHLANDEWMDWRVEPLTENPVVELYVDNTQDGGRGANVHFRSVTGETGEATYRIIAYGWDGREYFTDLTVRVVNADELELPGSEIIEIGQDYYHLDLNTEFNLGADCFTVNESLIPEGFGYYKELWGNDRIDGLWGTYWDDEGIHVHFGIEGRFELTAAVYITADYIITKPIVIEVGEVSTENAVLECVEYINAIYPSDGDSYIAAYELVGYDLVSTDDVQWEIVRFTDEFSPVTPIVDLSIGWISDGRNYVDIYAGPTHGEYDTELYDLICTVNGEKIAETRIEANVRPDENLPTELGTNAENDRHYINPWDVFEFHTRDFDISNGDAPEGVYFKKEVWVDEELQNTNGFEWLDDGGFRVQPDHDATYVFTAVVKIGTRCVTRDVILIVGNGDNSNYWVDWQDHAGELYLHHGDIYVSGVYINDYFLPDGMEVEWDVFRVDEDPSQVIWLEARDHRDGGLGVNLIAGQDNGDCGMNTWRVVARVGDEVLLERNFELYVSEMPENMPSNEDMWVELDEYHLNVGDTLDFNDSLFDLAEGDYDMGGWWKEVHVPEEWNELGVEWYDHNAFRVTFNENGRYTFRVAMLKNNVSVSREIRIIVGDGVPADAKLDVRRWLQALYVGGNEHLSDSCDGVNVRLKGYNRFENEHIQWEIKNVNEDGDYCAEAKIGPLSEDSLEADIEFFNIIKTGAETFRVTATTDCGVYEAVFPITVTDDLSGLPTYFEVDIAEHYGLGDSYCFSMNSISMDDDGRGGYQFHEDLENIFGNDGNEVWWDDNGLNIIFRTENTLEVPFRIEFGNYALEKTYVVTIGDGLRDDCHIQMEQFTNTVYIGSDDNMHLGWARLQNYTLLTGEEIEWTLEKINVSDNEPMELCFGDPNEYGANIHICNLTGEEGWVEYELTGTADRYSETHTIWVQVVNAPDNLPTEIWLENDVFMFSPGEQLHLNADFWAADGEVPENAYVSRWYEPSDAFNKNAEIEWHEDGGFTATLNADGRYTITACMQINNHTIRRDIIVSVGDGYNDDMRIAVDQRFTKGFNYSDDTSQHSIADLYLEGYQLARDEQIEWSIELVEPTDGTAPVELVINNVHNWGLNANVYACNPTGGTGTVTYEIKAYTSFGQEFTEYITFEMLNANDYSLPGALTGVETEVHLEAGETYVVDPAQIGWEAGEVPAGMENEVCLAYWNGFEYLEWLPGFVWREDGGFEVTFNRDGQFTYTIARRIGANHYVWKDVTITIGGGMVDTESIALNQNHYMQYMLTDVEPGTTVRHSELYLDGYTPYEGEQILWELYHIDGNPECAYLQIGDVWNNGLNARIDMVAGNGTEGWAEYELWVTTESGYRFGLTSGDDYCFGSGAVSPDASGVILPYSFYVDDVTIAVGEEYMFNAWESENSHIEAPDENYYYFNTEFVPDERLAAQESYHLYYDYDWRDEGFTFTPDQEGRYNMTVRLNFGGRILEDSFILTVGDGVADDVHLYADQHTDTIYLDGEENYLIGSVILNNYNFIGDEWAYWSIERIDENEGSPVELYLNRRQNLCTIGFENIQSTGSVTYRVTVNTNAGFTEYADFTLNVVERPDTLPTGFSFDLPTHYEIGETLRFNGLENIRFDDGEIPEGMEADVMVIDLQDNPIWYENGCSSGNGWFEANFGRNGRYSVEIRVKISNYVLTRMLDITVGTGVSDDAHMGVLTNEGWFYPNQGDAWVGDFYLNNYTLLSDETVEWTWERTGGEGDVDVKLYMADSWDGGLRMKLHSEGTGEELGWADYLLTVRTSHGFVQTFEFQVNVNEMPENMSMELTGADEYIVMLDQHNEIYAEDLVQAEGGMPDGNHIRYIIEADDELLNEEGFGGWMNESCIIFHPYEAACYTITVKAMAGNYLIGEKQVELIVCNPGIELFNGGSVVYEYEEGETWVADASIVNVPEMYADQIDWSLELPENSAAYCVRMYLGDRWDDGRSVGVLASYNGDWNADEPIDSMTCRLIARIGDVYETSVDLTVQVVQRPDNLPYLNLTDSDTDVWFEVGTPVTFDSTWFELVGGTIPEDAVVHDELWFCDDGLEQLDGFEMWENNRGIDGVGFSVTFNEPGRYHFYLVRKLNNITWAEEIRITAGDVQMTDLPMEIDLKTDTLYADCGDYYTLGEITIPGFTFFDADYVSGEVTCLTDTDLAELYVDEDYETGKIELWVSTGSETGTATYRVALMLDGEEIAATEVTLNVIGMPENLPAAIGYEKSYLLNQWGNYEPSSPGSFTVRLEDFCLADGEIPEDAVVEWILEEWHDNGHHTVVWHEDGQGFDLHFVPRADGYGSDATVEVSAYINNCCVGRYNLSICVDGGAPK